MNKQEYQAACERGRQEELKATKVPINLKEAFLLQAQISTQMVAEKKANAFHEEAQNLRLEIQKKMGLSVDEYYQFLQTAA